MSNGVARAPNKSRRGSDEGNGHAVNKVSVADRFDSEHLLSLAREKSKESRAQLTDIILELFDDRRGSLSDRERSLMYGILQGVIHDIEMAVRRKVADELAELGDVPRDLVTVLANDEIDVAYPILTKCGVLRDAELIDVIRMRTMEYQLAIAMRHGLSEQVSGALVETGSERVIVALLKNQNAAISERTMEYLVEQSRRVDSFQEPILQREDLRPQLAKKMFMWVSAALRQYILDNFPLDQQTVDDLLEQVAAQEIESTGGPTLRKAGDLAEALRNEGLVTPDMLAMALREGEVPLFVAMFCRLSDLREYLVMRLVFEPGGEGLAIACKGVGIGKAMYSTIYTLSQKAKAATAKSVKESLPKALAFYDAVDEHAASEVLSRWRRGADYLGAIRELQEGLKKK